MTRVGTALALVAAFLLPARMAHGQDEAPSAYDRIWGAMTLYSGDDDSFFQSFQLSGRIQLDWAYVDSGEETHDEFNVRRFRFGFKTDFLRDFTLHVEGSFDPQDADPLYLALTDAYLAWRHSPAFKVTAGKHSVGFTVDGMTSSKRLLTIDRSNLANNIWFTQEYFPGVSASGRSGDWTYFTGIFSSGEMDPEFGDFTGGEFEIVTLGYDFARRLGVEEALLRGNIVYNEPDPDNSATRPLEWVASLNFAFEHGRWGVRTDVSAARGYFEQPDLAAFMVMPFYDPTEAVQLVARYTHLDSDGPNGIRFARYESSLIDGRGDRYDEIYLGLNYYWYGHKLKLQNGIQWLEMRDEVDDGGAYDGWSWTTALRLSW